MTNAELVSQMAEKSNITKKAAEAALKSLVETVHQALQGEGQLRIDGLGTFKVTERKARTGVNPRTGAKLDIPATKAPTFKAAAALKEAVKDMDKKELAARPVEQPAKKSEKKKK
jgi:DNA-binding protein HU-beta